MPQLRETTNASVLSVPAAARELARAVLVHGPISRAELAGRLGLSVASLSRLGAPLVRQGLLREGELLNGGGVGRPVRLLDVCVEAGHFVGIKLTGGELYGVLTNLRAAPLTAERLELSSHVVTDVVDQIVLLTARLTAGLPAGLAGLGISLGGRVSDRGSVLRAPYLGWRDVPLADLVEARTGVPVVLDNDVQALTRVQQWFGAGRIVDDFAVLTIGAGVGYGLVLDDRLIESSDWGLGLIGHFPIEPSGPLCQLGHRGCANAFLTIEQICRRVSEAAGKSLNYDDVLRLAAEGHPVALSVLDQAGRALGVLVAAVANLTGVSTVVLSGEGIGLFDLVAKTVRSTVAEFRDAEAREVELAPAPGDFADWARGAAGAAIEQTLLAKRAR